MSHERFITCIDACNACATACDHCASEDLNENDVKKLTDCINLDRECSAFCRATSHIMSIGGQYAKDLCLLCATVCEACARECEEYSHMEHCKICAEECKNCAKECRKMAA